MRKIVLPILTIIILISGCSDNSTTPEVPKPKPKADVKIAVTQDPFVFVYNPFFGYWWSNFNVVLSEHNGVRVTITTLKLEFKDGNTVVATTTYSGGTLPSNGSLNIACNPVVWSYFNKMTIIVTGTDANSYSINVSRDYTWV